MSLRVLSGTYMFFDVFIKPDIYFLTRFSSRFCKLFCFYHLRELKQKAHSQLCVLFENDVGTQGTDGAKWQIEFDVLVPLKFPTFNIRYEWVQRRTAT
jgi:hypothetical protein